MTYSSLFAFPKESGTALLAEVAEVVQSCRVTGILESGWPLFSLLALLRRGLPEADRGGRLGRGAYDAWGKRVEAAWRSPAKARGLACWHVGGINHCLKRKSMERALFTALVSSTTEWANANATNAWCPLYPAVSMTENVAYRSFRSEQYAALLVASFS